MQVEVHDVEAGQAWLEVAQHRVHVGAVHVGQRTGRVDRLEQLYHVVLEEPQRGGVGEHHRRRARTQRGPQGLDVDHAVRSPR